MLGGSVADLQTSVRTKVGIRAIRRKESGGARFLCHCYVARRQEITSHPVTLPKNCHTAVVMLYFIVTSLIPIKGCTDVWHTHTHTHALKASNSMQMCFEMNVSEVYRPPSIHLALGWGCPTPAQCVGAQHRLWLQILNWLHILTLLVLYDVLDLRSWTSVQVNLLFTMPVVCNTYDTNVS